MLNETFAWTILEQTSSWTCAVLEQSRSRILLERQESMTDLAQKKPGTGLGLFLYVKWDIGLAIIFNVQVLSWNKFIMINLEQLLTIFVNLSRTIQLLSLFLVIIIYHLRVQ